MTKSNHTPGPWVHDGRHVYVPDYGRNIASVTELTMTNLQKQDDERKLACANARLIAAAPELLEACELLDFAYRDGADHGTSANLRILNDAWALAREAIAKAKGDV